MYWRYIFFKNHNKWWGFKWKILIDKIVSYERGKAIVGIKNVTTGFRDLGAIYENLVFLKIKGKKPRYVKVNGIEIDFHFNNTLIEAKYKNHPTRENLLEWGVDYIEIVNDDSQPENVFDQESYDFCMKHNGEIGMLTGTDMHKPDGLVSGGVHGWTLLYLKEFTEGALLEDLRKKKTNILYSEKPYLDLGSHK